METLSTKGGNDAPVLSLVHPTPEERPLTTSEKIEIKQSKQAEKEEKNHIKSIQRQGLELLKNGFSVLPVQLSGNKYDKQPAMNSKWELIKWKSYQEKPISKKLFNECFENNTDGKAKGIALISGFASGTTDSEGKKVTALQVIDIDQKNDPEPDLIGRLKKEVDSLMPDLWQKLVIQKTVNNGYHLLFNCFYTEGCQHLSKNESGGVTIETKGYREEIELKEIEENGKKVIKEVKVIHAGYFLIAHSSGYELIQGDFNKIPVISKDEFEVLKACAKSLDRSPVQKPTPHQSQAVKSLPKGQILTEGMQKYIGVCINNSLSKFIKSTDGAKHHTLRGAARTLGGYVGGGMISYNEAFSLLENAVREKKSIVSINNALRTVKYGLNKGAKEPFTVQGLQQNYYNYLLKHTQAPGAKSIRPSESNKAIKIHKYIGESPVLERELINPNGCGWMSLTAPTGSGKTHTVMHICFSLAKNYNQKCVIVLPYTALPQQIENEYNSLGVIAISGTSTDDQIKEAQSSSLVAVTYDSFNKVFHDVSEIDYLIIDESHNLVNQYSFRSKAINALQRAYKQIKNVVLISATPNPFFKLIGFREIIFTRESSPNVEVTQYTYEKGSAIDYALAEVLSTDFSKGIVVVKMNSKEGIETAVKTIVDSGKLTKAQITTVYNHEFLEDDAGYKSIIEESKIKDGVKLLFCTSKINDGVNIKNEDIQRVIIINERCTDSFMQFVARFRNVGLHDSKFKTLRVSHYRKAEKEDLAPFNFRLDWFFKSAQEFANNNASHFNKQRPYFEAMRLPKETVVSPDLFIHDVDGNWCIDHLHILYKMKTKADASKTLTQFCEELEQRTTNIRIVDYQFLTPIVNEERKKAKEELKAQKEEAYEKGLELFKQHLKSFLAVVYSISKDIVTRSKIEAYLGFIPQNSVELEMFKDEHFHLFKYDKVLKIAVCFLRLIDFGFNEKEALRILDSPNIVSHERFKRFINTVAIQRNLFFQSLDLSRHLPQKTIYELKFLKKAFKAIEKLGHTFTSKELQSALNRIIKSSSQRLSPNQCSEIIEYAFNYNKSRRTNDGVKETIYSVFGKIDLQTFLEKNLYLEDAEPYMARLLDSLSNHLEKTTSGHTNELYSVKKRISGVSSQQVTHQPPQKQAKTPFAAQKSGVSPEIEPVLYDGYSHDCEF